MIEVINSNILSKFPDQPHNRASFQLSLIETIFSITTSGIELRRIQLFQELIDI